MAHSRTQLQQARDILLKILAHQSAKNPASFLPGEAEDLALAPELLRLINAEIAGFNQQAVNDGFKTALNAIFAGRWQRIANSLLCYTRNAAHPFNQALILLAAYLNPEKRNTTLMPTIADSDIFGYELNQLELGEFIIADNKRQFITLQGLANSACERMLEQNEQLYVTVNEEGQTRALSGNELQRCGRVITVINSIAGWYRSHQGNHQLNFLSLLSTLRDRLLRGQVGHGGEELNAGRDANIGLANFYEYYTAMPEEDRRRLRAFRDGAYSLGTIFDRLFRPADANYREARFCIQTLGRLLEGIINVNADALSGLRVDQRQNLRNLINLVKTQLCGQDLAANPADPARVPNQRERSRVNSALTYNENEYVVSFIAPKSGFFVPAAAKIIVEGVKNGRIFVGSYYVTAKSGAGWLPEQVSNTKGIITRVKAFESFGYAQIPQSDADGHLAISDGGNMALKFDQIEELRKSLSRSHCVPAENVMDMINSIKQDVAATEFAHWVYGQNNLTAQEVNAILVHNTLRSLFLPYEPFGKHSFFGSGKNNCVTWCEDKMTIAGCGKRSVMDDAKAKPVMHVNW